MEISNYTDAQVDIYNTYRQPVGIQFIMDALLQCCSDAAPQSILDCGCGSGNYTRLLSECGHAITSIDNNVHMLSSLNQWVRENDIKNVATRRVDLRTCHNLPDSTFDAILVNQVVHHFNDHADNFACLRTLLHALAQRLKPGGRLILNTSSYEQHRFGMWWGYLIEKPLKDYCKRYCTFDTLRSIAEESRLKLVEQRVCTEPFLGAQYFDPGFVLDGRIRKTDTLWQYVDDATYESIVRALAASDLPALFEEHNMLEKYGQSTFFTFTRDDTIR